MKTIKFDMHFILQLVASLYYIWMELTVIILLKLNFKIEKYTFPFLSFIIYFLRGTSFKYNQVTTLQKWSFLLY